MLRKVHTERDINELIERLRDSRSATRRSAAKRLRAAGQPSAAPALREALGAEVKERRTWETQYQLVMALASCGTCDRSRNLVESLFSLDLEPMVHVAAGDAAVRLHPEVDEAVLAALDSGSLARAEGSIRALAMIKAVPSDSVVASVIDFARVPSHRQVRFWVAAAAAGWPKLLVKDFLVSCLTDESADTRRAAGAAMDGRYLKWNPL